MPFSCQNYFTSFRPISIINHPSIVSKNLSANFQTKKAQHERHSEPSISPSNIFGGNYDDEIAIYFPE
jgi:hypothetical protein